MNRPIALIYFVLLSSFACCHQETSLVNDYQVNDNLLAITIRSDKPLKIDLGKISDSINALSLFTTTGNFSALNFTEIPCAQVVRLNIVAAQYSIGVPLEHFGCLTELSLNECFNITLPSSLYELHQLKKLTLRDHLLENIPEGMCGMDNLEYLNLSNNNIQNIDPSCPLWSKLDTLVLVLNGISDSSIQKLINIYPKMNVSY